MALAMTAELGEALGFGIEFVAVDGRGRRGPLSGLAASRFEDALPVRRFRWARSQEHMPGWWWSASSQRHVGYESWLERDHAILLDFDPGVVAFSSQPFWLSWHNGQCPCRHCPDFFVRLDDGSGVVVDVRADERIEARDTRAFAAMQAACALVGWEFRRVGVPGPVLVANVRWLSRYRHPRCRREPIAARLLEVFARPGPLRAGAAEAGDLLASLPVLYHLLWYRALRTDLSTGLLGSHSTVFVPAAGAR